MVRSGVQAVSEDEVLLGVGSPATRVGDTVRRPVQPWTPGVTALLRHLEEVGFDGAPRSLGVDDQGREVVTYLPSDPTWPYSEDVLVAVGRLVRRLHVALAGFAAPGDAVWALRHGDGVGFRFGHNDIGPPNTVYAGGVPYAFIDWELSGPAPALFDVVSAACNFVPLRPDHFCRAVGFSELPDRGARLRLFCDAYGLTDRTSLLDVIEEYLRGGLREIVELGGQGVLPFSRYLARGADRFLRWDLDWVGAHRVELERALG